MCSGVPAMRLAYRAKIEKDEDSFLVTFPDLPDANTFGTGPAEALANAIDSLDVTLAGRIKDRTHIPLPSSLPSEVDFSDAIISPSALVATKAMLYMEIRSSGISQAELARRIGKHKEQIARLLDPAHKSSLPLLEKALAAVGRRLVVSVE